jgi:hypothetical protein
VRGVLGSQGHRAKCVCVGLEVPIQSLGWAVGTGPVRRPPSNLIAVQLGGAGDHGFACIAVQPLFPTRHSWRPVASHVPRCNLCHESGVCVTSLAVW